MMSFYEGYNGRIERTIKHFIISANLGYDDSIEALKREYTRGRISKEDLEAALRAHQASTNEKSAEGGGSRSRSTSTEPGLIYFSSTL